MLQIRVTDSIKERVGGEESWLWVVLLVAGWLAGKWVADAPFETCSRAEHALDLLYERTEGAYFIYLLMMPLFPSLPPPPLFAISHSVHLLAPVSGHE